MDEVLSQILDACNLAKELDASIRLSPASLDPHFLSSSCDDIAAAFHRAVLRLSSLPLPSPPPPAAYAPRIPYSDPAAGGQGGGSPSNSYPQAIDLLRTTRTPEDDVVHAEGPSSQRASRKKRKEGTVTKRVPALRTGNIDVPPDDGYTWRKYGQKDILNSMFPRSYYRCTHKSYYGCEAKKQVQRLDDEPYMFEVTYCGSHTCQTSPTPILIPTRLLPPAADSAAEPIQPQPASSSQSAVQLRDWLESGSNVVSLGALLLPRSGVDASSNDEASLMHLEPSPPPPSSSQSSQPNWLERGRGALLLPRSGVDAASSDGASLMQLESNQQSASAPAIQLRNWLESGSIPMSSGALPLPRSGIGGGGGGGSRQGGGGHAQQGGRDAECTSVAELADAMFNSGSSGSSMDVIFSPRHRN